MQALLVIWTKSRHYNSSGRLVPMLQLIMDNLVAQTRSYMPGEPALPSWQVSRLHAWPAAVIASCTDAFSAPRELHGSSAAAAAAKVRQVLWKARRPQLQQPLARQLIPQHRAWYKLLAFTNGHQGAGCTKALSAHHAVPALCLPLSRLCCHGTTRGRCPVRPLMASGFS